ncbi:alkaline-phosphatase-like protein [Daedaleopsis nitida]|nr:alkaline-phosphatase-like protein [Daedaleopsis nitida]
MALSRSTSGALLACFTALLLTARAATAKQPNILFLFTDDQDLLLGSMNYMDAITERVQSKGFTFENHHATVSLCCPSRVAILRGQHAHNTNNTFVSAPGGGYNKFVLSGEDRDYLPHWVKRAGYRAEYIGKLMNAYSTDNYAIAPKGWDHFDGLLDPYTYIYLTPAFSLNGQKPVYYQEHQTDVIRAKAYGPINLSYGGEPWYLTVAPTSPHQQFNDKPLTTRVPQQTGMWPPVPLERHMNLYPGLQAPRTPNFNPATQNKPSWIGELPVMDETSIAFSDETYRRRAQAITGVNEMFHELLDILEDAGELNNTYVIFSADHGYHVGQHRVPAGKMLPYREDTQVPFIISGPGIPHGNTSLPSNHVDIAPTLLTFLGLPQDQWPKFFDGRDLSPYWSANEEQLRATLNPAPESLLIEFWGPGAIEATGLNLDKTSDLRNTYKTIRIVGADYGYLYTYWCTNQTELYDTVADPYELSPLDLSAPANAPVVSRLNGLLLAAKSCEQDGCRAPWSILHPDGSVRTLKDALASKYDAFYASLPEVHFKTCLLVQSRFNEQPFYPFTDGVGPSLGSKFRQPTDDYGVNDTSSSTPAKRRIAGRGTPFVPLEEGHRGAVYRGPEAIEATKREFTDEELDWQLGGVSDFYVEYTGA